METCSVDYHHNCLVMTSGDFRIAVTTAVGPRIIGGWIGDSDNIFKVLPDEPLTHIGNGFKLYGGHRLWHAPEAAPRSYAPDNAPVIVTEVENGYEFANEPEPSTGIQKSIAIEAIDNGFRLTHRLSNTGPWTVTLAPWALSVMAPGGMAIIPQLRDLSANPYAADRQIVYWPYSSPADPRIVYGDKYICLRQDPAATSPCKLGFNADEGWIGYVNHGTALIKYFEPIDDAEYPDGGCSVETYSCDRFCEIETLAPLFELDPEEECEHVEFWQGIAGLPDIKTVDDIEAFIEPQLL